MAWALHGANILILCSFLVRDILALRLLSIGAGILFCTYFFAHDMIEPIVWNTLFSIVNVVQIGRMWMQRRKIPLTDEERFLYEGYFSSLHAFDIRALCKEAHVHRIKNKDSITLSGLGVIFDGDLRIEDEVISKGSFVGVRSFLERKDISMEGIVDQDVICIQWSMSSLRTWADHDPNRNNLLLRALSNDLLSKVSHVQSAKE
ncbi:MAG: hypothetical protein CL916_06760 [Deltaproteobacteria bacterium]|nr:hypothetical protein [Deltaproteobacteria bacterium]